ncbi:alpha/beta hydrolase [Hylemonella sp. W303a]|uniref:alpha/beta hydrolase n=1 Tax=Hylemonella sp. W303a TaxID=3389873 RepID=UPI00396B3F25
MRRRLLLWTMALLLCLVLSGCTSVFFQPMRPWVRTPATVGLDYENLNLQSADGTTVNAWFLPARDSTSSTAPNSARGTILFLHGNAQNISTHLASVYWLPERGYNVLLLDYRGYGASQGAPSVEGAQLDIDTALRHLLARPDVDRRRIVLLGQSLGGALGMHYAAHGSHRQHLRAAVIDSAFTGYRDIAREKLRSTWVTWPFSGFLPWLVTGDYNPLDAAPRISPVPLLLVHGDRDDVIPLHHARQLYEAAREPKTLWVIEGAAHIQALEQPQVRDRWVAWLESQLGGDRNPGARGAAHNPASETPPP